MRPKDLCPLNLSIINKLTVVISSARKRVLIAGCFADSSRYLPKNRRPPRPRSPPVRLSSAIGLYRRRLGPSPPPPPSTRAHSRRLLVRFRKTPSETGSAPPPQNTPARAHSDHSVPPLHRLRAHTRVFPETVICRRTRVPTVRVLHLQYPFRLIYIYIYILLKGAFVFDVSPTTIDRDEKSDKKKKLIN